MNRWLETPARGLAGMEAGLRRILNAPRSLASEEPFGFDDLAKTLAGGMSRRDALRRIAGGLAGTALASLGVRAAWGDGLPEACRVWCQAHFAGSAGEGPMGDCMKGATHGTGPCYQCGPLKPAGSTQELCGAACTDKATDPNNCGACGNVCANGTACCSGSCANLATDPDNCGACGTVCGAGQTCDSGTCVTAGCGPSASCGEGNCCGNDCCNNAELGVCLHECSPGNFVAYFVGTLSCEDVPGQCPPPA